MKNKNTSRLIYSIAGGVLIFAIVIAINAVSSAVHGRFDLTQDQIFTLTPQTKNILSKLDTPVIIKFYFSRNNNRIPVFFKNYAKQVQDLLNEYKEYSHGHISVEMFDPEPASDAEDAANLDGVKGQQLNTGDTIYMGLAVTCLDNTIAIPFLNPQQDSTLEYDITNAITQVTNTVKPVLGVMSALPVLGEKFNPMMLRMGAQGAGMEPWVVIQQLKKDYDVREIPMDAESIDPEVENLLVIHPCGISERTEFTLDQFLLRGGKMIAFVDPLSYFAMAKSRESQDYYAKTSSDLKTLFKAWGIQYDPQKVVADMTFADRRNDLQKRITYPTILQITAKGINQNDIPTANLNTLTMVFSGGFTGEPAGGLRKSVLIHSTKDSCLQPTSVANEPEKSFKNFHQGDKEYDLAITLSGTFRTAFPGGKPEAPKDPKDKADAKKEKTEKENTPGDFLKEGTKETMVMLIADSDMLVNDVCVRIQNFLGQQLITMQNQNLNFTQNLVDFAGGDRDLIGIRCRQKVSRPFEIVKELQAEAEKKYKSKIDNIEKELQNTERRINELQRDKKKGQLMVLSPEQKEEIKKFQEQQIEVRKELKKVTKELRRDIDSLQNKLKLVNIAMMPVIVILFGGIVAIIRKRRSAAK